MQHLRLGVFLLGLSLSLVAVVVCLPRTPRKWLMAALPADDAVQLRSAMDDLLDRLQPEMSGRDSVFDLTTVLPAPTTQASFAAKRQETHPYMYMLYEEINRKMNEKWAEMKSPNAAVRGIEPINTMSLEPKRTIVLTFAIGTINDLNSIHHVDFVLTDSLNDKLDMEDVDTVEVSLEGANDTTPAMKLETFRKSYGNESYLVLEMTPTIRQWWNKGHLNATQKMRLTAPKAVDLHLKRPLLVFYYVTNREIRAKRSRRSPGYALVYGKSEPRPCGQKCYIGRRVVNNDTKVPPLDTGNRMCSLRNWDVTLQDLRWEAKVVAPYSLQMNYCSGSCDGPIYDTSFNATNHAVVRNVLMIQNQNGSNSFPPPYCVPTALESHTFLLVSKGQILLKTMDNIIAKTCGCR